MKPESKKIAAMRKDAIRIFHEGLRAVEPATCVNKYCRLEDDHLLVGNRTYNLKNYNNIFIIGAGKASAPMALALEELLGKRIRCGIVNVKYDHIAELKHVQLIEAGHPIPDENGQRGAEEILNLAQNAKKNDLLFCLISGGGSALLPLPFAGLSLKDKQETIKVLLACGATIHEINAIRKHTSMLKGGRLAQAAYPATLISLILSDVVGDNLDVIASGPTVPDPSTFRQCQDIFNKYNITDKLPVSVKSHIQAGAESKVPETPKDDDPVFAKTHNLIIGNNFEAIMSARHQAENLGYNVLVLSSMIEGETMHVAGVHGAIAREILKTGHPLAPPVCILSGGETTVSLKGTGLGGRNQEFALAAAIDIAGSENIVVLSGGTDGTDGPTDAAGALADTTTVERAGRLGLNPQHFLADNDSYQFFQTLDDLLITGPTNTNVMDLRIVIVAE